VTQRTRHFLLRLGFVVGVSVVWVWTIGAVLLFHSYDGLGTPVVRTHIGFLEWLTFTDARPVRVDEAIVPGSGVVARVHPVRLVITLMIVAAVTGFLVHFVRRTFAYFEWDLVRADGCPVCDYSLAGRRESGCPECGWGMDPRPVSGCASATRRAASSGSPPARPRRRAPA
jgi:hypothetical protein